MFGGVCHLGDDLLGPHSYDVAYFTLLRSDVIMCCCCTNSRKKKYLQLK